ncbi:MAG: hypothetical protein IJV00_04485 [Clostridia bacterium]|nr:hypothetical protein [Clostridia bacterium]
MVTNVYERHFEADAEFSGVKRRGALVMLISDSEAGSITYKAAVTFFAHENDEDFAVSYDAYLEKELFSAKGRRSKKKEAAFIENLAGALDGICAAHNAVIKWDRPLREERRG